MYKRSQVQFSFNCLCAKHVVFCEVQFTGWLDGYSYGQLLKVEDFKKFINNKVNLTDAYIQSRDPLKVHVLNL